MPHCINYKFHVFVHLLTIKISQQAREDFAVIVKLNIEKFSLYIDILLVLAVRERC